MLLKMLVLNFADDIISVIKFIITAGYFYLGRPDETYPSGLSHIG
jgi:hypothetical protein